MKTRKTLIGLGLLAMAIIPLSAIFLVPAYLVSAQIVQLFSALTLIGMAFAIQDNDSTMVKTKALPDGAATTITDGIDLGHGANGDVGGNFELQIEAPALATAALPDTKTMTFDVYHDTAVGFGTEVLLMGSVIVQTGADGAGAAAVTKQVRLPVDCNRYIRVKATNSGTGDASGSDMTARLVF